MMERQDILATMGELKLFGMKAAYDEINPPVVATASPCSSNSQARLRSASHPSRAPTAASSPTRRPASSSRPSTDRLDLLAHRGGQILMASGG
jgi:hypothetical protein